MRSLADYPYFKLANLPVPGAPTLPGQVPNKLPGLFANRINPWQRPGVKQPGVAGRPAGPGQMNPLANNQQPGFGGGMGYAEMGPRLNPRSTVPGAGSPTGKPMGPSSLSKEGIAYKRSDSQLPNAGPPFGNANPPNLPIPADYPNPSNALSPLTRLPPPSAGSPDIPLPPERLPTAHLSPGSGSGFYPIEKTKEYLDKITPHIFNPAVGDFAARLGAPSLVGALAGGTLGSLSGGYGLRGTGMGATAGLFGGAGAMGGSSIGQALGGDTGAALGSLLGAGIGTGGGLYLGHKAFMNPRRKNLKPGSEIADRDYHAKNNIPWRKDELGDLMKDVYKESNLGMSLGMGTGTLNPSSTGMNMPTVPTVGTDISTMPMSSMGKIAKLNKISPFCAGFLQACYDKKFSKQATFEAIHKSVAKDPSLEKEWNKLFEKAALGLPGLPAPVPPLNPNAPKLPGVTPPLPPGQQHPTNLPPAEQPKPQPQPPATPPKPPGGNVVTTSGAPVTPGAQLPGQAPVPNAPKLPGVNPPPTPGQPPANLPPGEPGVAAQQGKLPPTEPSMFDNLWERWGNMSPSQQALLLGGGATGIAGLMSGNPLMGIGGALAAGSGLTGKAPWDVQGYLGGLMDPSSWGAKQGPAAPPPGAAPPSVAASAGLGKPSTGGMPNPATTGAGAKTNQALQTARAAIPELRQQLSTNPVAGMQKVQQMMQGMDPATRLELGKGLDDNDWNLLRQSAQHVSTGFAGAAGGSQAPQMIEAFYQEVQKAKQGAVNNAPAPPPAQ